MPGTGALGIQGKDYFRKPSVKPSKCRDSRQNGLLGDARDVSSSECKIAKKAETFSGQEFNVFDVMNIHYRFCVAQHWSDNAAAMMMINDDNMVMRMMT